MSQPNQSSRSFIFNFDRKCIKIVSLSNNLETRVEMSRLRLNFPSIFVTICLLYWNSCTFSFYCNYRQCLGNAAITDSTQGFTWPVVTIDKVTGYRVGSNSSPYRYRIYSNAFTLPQQHTTHQPYCLQLLFLKYWQLKYAWFSAPWNFIFY